MFKLIITAGIVSLLAACSSMSGSSTTSSSGMSRGSTMGAPGALQNGTGPRGSSGGGPN